MLEKLVPSMVWSIFEDIFCKTYRPSNKEAQIRAKLLEWVNVHKNVGLKATIDAVGNILIKKKASPGYENVLSLLFQGHMDMVTESSPPGSFNFEISPIPIVFQENGKWVGTRGTTLGADNGIGLAIIMALLLEPDNQLPHGPLELLITVAEEVGLDGAFGLDPQTLGISSHHMINVDSEELGLITIGAAGGGDIYLERSITWKQPEPKENLDFWTMIISGLQGGHSGAEIHLPRGNANKIAARIFAPNSSDQNPILISDWTGGDKHNAIPRDCSVTFAIPRLSSKGIISKITLEIEIVKQYYAGITPSGKAIEPDLKIELKKGKSQPYLDGNNSNNLIKIMNVLPHGMIRMSPVIPNLVETSVNLASIRTEKEKIIITMMARSNIDDELSIFRQSIQDLAILAGWSIKMKDAYPGWAPDLTQPLLKYVKEQYAAVISENIRVEAIHAGLECGIIGKRIPGMQMIAMGPTVRGLHSPEERVEVASVEKAYTVLHSVIKNLKNIEKMH